MCIIFINAEGKITTFKLIGNKRFGLLAILG
jgi:hypothetical protein